MSASLEITLSGTEELSGLLDAIEAFGDDHGVPIRTVMTLNLVVEELVTNALQHGARPDGATVTVRAAVVGDRVDGSVRDNGVPFNPLVHASPDIEAQIEDRPIGGLGLHIVREMAQNLVYERDGPDNVLNFQLAFQEG